VRVLLQVEGSSRQRRQQKLQVDQSEPGKGRPDLRWLCESKMLGLGKLWEARALEGEDP
jgi:hypothetical protein